MKIGFDARMIDWAGVGTYSYNLLKALKEIDKENEYILFCDRNSISQVPYADNFSKRVISESIFSSFHQLFFSISLKKQSLDIFHSPHFIFPLFLSCSSVVTIHDLIPLVFPSSMPSKLGRFYYQKVNSKVAKKTKIIIAVSNSTKKDLLEQFDVPEEKIRVIYNGVAESFDVIENETLLDEVKKKYKIRSKVLLSVGNPKPHKDWLGLIEAFARLGSEAQDYQLVLVGSRDPRYPKIDQLIKKLHLEDRVVITGFVKESDMPLLYNSADVFIFPSLYEGFGLPVLEAMACGTPVLCSNFSSLPEVAGDATLMFDPNDKNSLIEGIENLLSDEKLKKDLSEKGLKRAKLFSWEKTAQQTLEVYREIKSS
jgi:glycosyltransferase involved in cell wall biosynthesis